jgi:hypothetical protein
MRLHTYFTVTRNVPLLQCGLPTKPPKMCYPISACHCCLHLVYGSGCYTFFRCFSLTPIIEQAVTFVLQNLEYYMTVEVIEPHWHEMTEKLRECEHTPALITAFDMFHLLQLPRLTRSWRITRLSWTRAWLSACSPIKSC